MAFLIGLVVVVALLIGILLGRRSAAPPRHDALGQELSQWAKEEEGDLPERQRRARAEAGRRHRGRQERRGGEARAISCATTETQEYSTRSRSPTRMLATT
jgi:hypothetical protein